MTIFTKSHDDIARFFVSEADDETVAVPTELLPLRDAGRLRIAAGQVIDIATYSGDFFVDPEDARLLLHITPADGLIPITCAWNADLIMIDGVVMEKGLIAIKANRVSVLRATCAATIVGGFRSSGLGEPHTYPSDTMAQINLMGSVMDSILPGLPADWKTPFWTASAAGEWAFRLHTASQIQQAGRDGKAHVVTCQSILEDLSTQIMAATSAEEIAAISWPEGETV